MHYVYTHMLWGMAARSQTVASYLVQGKAVFLVGLWQEEEV